MFLVVLPLLQLVTAASFEDGSDWHWHRIHKRYASDVNWALDRINQRNASKLDGKIQNVAVGDLYVIGSGVRATHSEFEGRVREGWSFDDSDARTDCSSGDITTTGVTSVAAGSNIGIAREGHVVPVKVTCSSFAARDGDIRRAVEWISSSIDRQRYGHRAVLLVATSLSKDQLVMINTLSESALIVIPAGDSGIDTCSQFPQDLDGALIVAASNKDDQQASRSNFGPCVDIFAPGEDVRVAGVKDDASLSAGSSTRLAAAAVAGVALQNAIEIKEVDDVLHLKALILGHSTRNVLTGIRGDTPNKLLFDICPYFKLPEHGRCYVAQTKQDSEKRMKNLAKSVITFDYSNYNYYDNCLKAVIFQSPVTSSRVEVIHKYDEETEKELPPVFVVSTAKSTIELHPGPIVIIDGSQLEGESVLSSDKDNWYSIRSEKVEVPKAQELNQRFIPLVTITLPFEVKVIYDGLQEIGVLLGDTDTFYEKTEGICGFFDKSHVLEFVDRKGNDMEQTGNSQKSKFVKEWTSENLTCDDTTDDLCISTDCHDKANRVCSPLRNIQGVFNQCFDDLDPKPWYENCIDAVRECCCKGANVEECACTEQRKYWWAAFTLDCPVAPPCETPCEKPQTDPQCKDDSRSKLEYVYDEKIKYDAKDHCHCNPEHEDITCKHDGTWNRPVPDCQVKTCSAPNELSLAAISEGRADSYQCGDKVTYSCAKTECDCNCYEMTGSPTSVCSGSSDTKTCVASWSHDAPTCRLKHCPDPQPPNVDINIDNGGSQLSMAEVSGTACCSGKVKYSCHECYELEGDQEHTCCNNVWGNGALPTCKLKQCSDPQLEIDASGDPHLVVKYTKLYCSYEAVFSCNDDCYELDGSESRKCSPDGRWSGSLPRCVLRSCPTLPPSYTDGYYTHRGEKLSEDNVLKCGDHVNANCDSCYYPCGSVCSRTCTWNGTHTVWDSEEPLCAKRVCPERHVDNAVVVANSGLVDCGDSSTVRCNTCYKAVQGDSVRTCRVSDKSKNTCPPTYTDGEYDGTELVCKKMTCPELNVQSPLEIQDKTCTNGMECDCVVTFKCPSCYTLKGEQTLTCKGDGWDYEVPTCERMTCSVPKTINEISRRYMPPTEGGCQMWRGDELIDENTVIYCDDTLHVKANFSDCFHVCGEKNLTCKGNDVWDPPNANRYALCYLVTCGSAPDAINAGLIERKNRNGEVIRYRNKDGNLVWTDDRFSDDRPECHDKARYKCDKCYKHVSGDLERTCVAIDIEKKWTGKWNGTKPVCKKMACDEEAPPIVNGTVISEDVECGGKVSYECNKCNRLVGDNNVMCDQPDITSTLLSWANSPPTCEPICCPAILPVKSTDPDYVAMATHVRYLHGAIQMHVPKMMMSTQENFDTCNENYVCQQVEAKCDICYEYENDAFAPIRTCEKYSEQINGVEVIKGRWTNLDKVCTRKSCPVRDLITDVNHAHYKTSDMATTNKCNQTVEIECDCCHRISPDVITEEHVCQEDKTWSRDLPVCTAISCEDPADIDNGFWKRIQPSESCSCGEVRYECDSCYRLVGSDTLTCRQDKNRGTASWSSEPPVCEPICCEAPTAPKDTYLKEETANLVYLKEFRTSMPLTYDQMSVKDFYDTCTINYVCQQIQPKCTECFEYREEDGTTDGGKINPPVMECMRKKDQTTGHWTNEDKYCTIKTCEYREPKANSFYENGYGSDSVARCRDEISISCDSCFEFDNGDTSQKHTCLPSKEWSKPMPTCTRKLCPVPPSIDQCTYTSEGGNECGSSRVLTCDNCYYHPKCHDATQEKKSLTVTCGADKVWSWAEGKPTLQKRQCDRPVDLQNGIVKFDKSEDFGCGSEVRYECNRCYKFSHDANCLCEKRKCIPDPKDCTKGIWNETAPVCERITCPIPESLEHGRIVESDNTCDGSVKYECDEGYYMVDGDDTRNCTEQGTWTGKMPRCAIKMCTAVGDSPFREHNLTDPTVTPYGTFVEFRCRSCYELQASAVDPDTLARKTVYPRYYLLYCQSSGNWNGSEPVCREQRCNSPGTTPANARAAPALSSYACGDSITYTCNKGYKFTPGSKERLTCQAGVWSHGMPSCEPVGCGELPSPSPLQLETSGNEYGDEGEYNCGKGKQKFCYEDLETKSSTCNSDGSWSYVAVSSDCKRKNCGSLPEVENGSVDVRFKKRDAVDCLQQIIVSCNAGYQLQGKSLLICRSRFNGPARWSPAVPKCVPKTCPVQEEPLNGIVEPSSEDQKNFPESRYYQKTLKYRCKNECYKLSHENARRCDIDSQKNLVWTASEPLCERIACYLKSIENGYLAPTGGHYIPLCGEKVTVNCDPGYKLEGDEDITCLPTGDYSTALPKCVPVTCPILDVSGLDCVDAFSRDTPPRPMNSYKCSCKPGYREIDDETTNSEVTCLDNGSWNYDLMKCERIQCDTLTEPENSVITYNADRTIAKVTCDTCYTLSGSHEEATCDINGRWSRISGCRKKVCQNPGAPDNGRIISDTRGNSVDYTCDTRVTYMCDSGYQILGEETIICDGNKWNHERPLCTKTQCPSLAVVPNSKTTISGDGSAVTYVCNEGYQIYGDPVRRCLKGTQWSGPGPTSCELKHCGNVGGILYGKVKTVNLGLGQLNDTLGAVVEYSCIDERYKLDGVSRRECTANKEWTYEQPRCVCVSCPPLDSPPHGYVESPGENKVGTTVQYICNEGFELIGNNEQECLDTGDWSGATPTCQRITCSKPGRPEGGRFKGPTKSSYFYLEKVTVICEPFKNELVYSCGEAGKWEGDVDKNCSKCKVVTKTKTRTVKHPKSGKCDGAPCYGVKDVEQEDLITYDEIVCDDSPK